MVHPIAFHSIYNYFCYKRSRFRQFIITGESERLCSLPTFHNDFLLESKFWPMVEGVANKVGLTVNLRTIFSTNRKAGSPIFTEASVCLTNLGYDFTNGSFCCNGNGK
jgi:hypothetical protein